MIAWTVVAVALAVALAASAAGLDPARRWWSLAGVAPVAAAIVLGAAGIAPPGRPASAIAFSAGFLALSVVGGSGLTTIVLRAATRSVPLGLHGGILVADDKAVLPSREILRGGTTIGYLERFAFVGAVLAGQAEAIAAIVAIKGLARFSELENAAARERFIIGTLTSFAWAGCCCAAALLSR